MSEELTLQEKTELSKPMNERDVIEQINTIQHIMKAVMQEGQHFGIIPGCGDKPALLKPGAEKLALTFRLAPRFTIQSTDLPNGHREYRIVTELYHILTGNFVGSGVGCATTLEGKYRFRTESTGREVPKEYWNKRDPSLLGGIDFSARKKDNQWVIYHKVEHDNPADYYNTVLKIAKKRSLTDAILTATAASDIFTQDIEENPELFGGKPETTPIKSQEKKEIKDTENQPEHPVPAGIAITDSQIKKIQVTFSKDYGIDGEDLRHAVSGILLNCKIQSFKELTKREGIALIEKLLNNHDEVETVINSLIESEEEKQNNTIKQNSLPF